MATAMRHNESANEYSINALSKEHKETDSIYAIGSSLNGSSL